MEDNRLNKDYSVDVYENSISISDYASGKCVPFYTEGLNAQDINKMIEAATQTLDNWKESLRK